MQPLADIKHRQIDLKPMKNVSFAKCSSAAVSPDESLLVTGHINGFILVWDTMRFEARNMTVCTQGIVKDMVFLDERHLVVISTTGNVVLLKREENSNNFSTHRNYVAKIGPLNSIVYNKRMNCVLVTGDKGFRLYRILEKNNELTLVSDDSLCRPSGPSFGAFFHNVQNRIAVAHNDIIFSYTVTNNETNMNTHLLAPGSTRSRHTVLAFIPLPNLAFLSVDKDDKLEYWSFSQRARREFTVDALRGYATSVVCTEDGNQLLVGTRDGSIILCRFEQNYKGIRSTIALERRTLQATPKKLILFKNERFLFSSAGINENNALVLDFGGERFGEIKPPITDLEELFRC